MDDNDLFLESLAFDPSGLARQAMSLASALHIIVAAVMGFLVLWVYYQSSSREHRDRNLSLIIPVLSVLMAVIMRVEGTQIVLFFGIFGILSIVRFRSDLTDQRGIAFILFAVIEGVLVGTSSWILSVLAWIVVSGSILIGRRLLKAPSTWRLNVKLTSAPADAIRAVETWLKDAGMASKHQSTVVDSECTGKNEVWATKTRLQFLIFDQTQVMPDLLPAMMKQFQDWGFEAECRRGRDFLD